MYSTFSTHSVLLTQVLDYLGTTIVSPVLGSHSTEDDYDATAVRLTIKDIGSKTPYARVF